jgi:hypothetical protein
MRYKKVALTKRRLHCLRMALIRIRYIQVYMSEDTPITSMEYCRMNDSKIIMNLSLLIYQHFEYCGPPDYLYNFAPDEHDILSNMVLHYDDPKNYFTYLANVYGMVRQTPMNVLHDFMFNSDYPDLYYL